MATCRWCKNEVNDYEMERTGDGDECYWCWELRDRIETMPEVARRILRRTRRRDAMEVSANQGRVEAAADPGGLPARGEE